MTYVENNKGSFGALYLLSPNRMNATHSTGPRSAAGKTASSRNAVRHNLSPGATFTLLPGEDAEAFEQLVRDYREDFQPRTAHEVFLVNQMVQAQWRMSRIERLQAEVLDIILNVPAACGKSDEAAIVASLGFAHGQTLDRLERYARAAERAYFRATKELKQYRAEKQNQAKSAPQSPRPLRAPTSLAHAPLEQNEAKSLRPIATALPLPGYPTGNHAIARPVAPTVID